ncbi:acetylcholinesterase [Galendromus occidentalis]|uniref:Carboxylic ester hydrolase n=1 Tax=Galendromus occidentalis TaxID=34638 RepID=A0AAJ6QVU3_9ACAR|nr:acetylcholinesterase [Galendromus occidentalis]
MTLAMDSTVVLLCCLLGSSSADPVVEGSLGKISGTIEKILDVEVEAFLGIPYAKPPVEELRFARPEPFGPVGNLEATELPQQCPQFPMHGSGRYSDIEDCLYLNVYRKRGTTPEDKKPVLATIHGGSYSAGSSADVNQSAKSLVGFGDVILVSFNYRLGILGFADMKGNAPGNLGLHDQRLALKWIKENIADFGGDPEKVTLMGDSAGSMSVAAQIVSIADSDQLFHAAILDGGVVASNGYLEDSESSFTRIKRIAEIVECPTECSVGMVTCLRSLPVAALLANSTTTYGSTRISMFMPTTDGVFLPEDVQAYVANASSRLPKIPIIIGYSLDEGSFFLGSVGDREIEGSNFDYTREYSRSEILDFCSNIGATFNFPFNASQGDIREKIGKVYVDENSGVAKEALSAFLSDGLFKCPINAFIRDYSRHSDKVFAYQFDRKLKKTYFKLLDPSVLGVFHYSPYLHFAGVIFLDEGPVDEEDRKFALDAMDTIANFIKSAGAPKFRGVEWPEFSSSGKVFIFDETPKVAGSLSREQVCKELFSIDRVA